MTELLTELLNAGLIENLGGDDERFAKIKRAAENDTNVAILWLTAADTLPLLRQGKEYSVIRKLLKAWAERVEEKGLAISNIEINELQSFISTGLKLIELEEQEPRKVDRQALLNLVSSSAGPNN